MKNRISPKNNISGSFLFTIDIFPLIFNTLNNILMNSEKQRKILQIITKSNFGGAQKYVYEISTDLKERGHDVVIAHGGNGILVDKLKKGSVRTIKINYLNRNINIFSDLKVFFEIIKIISKEKPDIVHLNSSKIGAIGSFAARMCFVPRIVFTIHGLAFNENRSWISKIIIKKIYWLTIFLCHKSIAVSESVKKQLLSIPFFFLLKNKITVIKNEIREIDFVERNNAKKFIGEKIKKDLTNKKIIGTIAELHKIKGINFLIESAKEIVEENNDVVFIVFGEGEERNELQKQIKYSNLQNNFFLIGFIDNAPKYLNSIDLFVLPSISEGLALALLEARQANLNIIASKVGGIPEALEGYTKAKLFESGNTKELTNLIHNFLNEKNDNNKTKNENLFELMIEKTLNTYKY
jgi:glycosyltransferase involved in cell wall biosynthesis